MNRSEIRNRVRRLIRAHELGCAPNSQLWAGTNGHTPCAACGLPIPKGAVEYEIVQGKQSMRFHFECHAVWKEECGR